jgi:hypothetical protein
MPLCDLALVIFGACEKKKIYITIEMKLAIYMYAQILSTFCSQSEEISKSILMLPNVRLPVKKMTYGMLLKLGVIKFAERLLCKQYLTVEVHNH